MMYRRIRHTFLAAAPLVLAASLSAQGTLPAPDASRTKEGALSGASIFLSPGHGWYYNERLGRWATQRGNSHGIIEDHSNAEAVLQYLVPYLENAGARVYVSRERDMNPNMVIVEPGTPGYSQEGDWTLEETSGAWNGDQRAAATTAGSPTARATFTPEIPEAGYYGVYVHYSPTATGSTTTDAHITVRHTGGSTLHRQDQNVDGHTWKYLGTYWFDSGRSEGAGSVEITNRSATGGSVVADAVRFGGGTGEIPDGEGGVSGKPRWEESGYYHSRFMGYDPELETRRWSTVSAMPLWSEWEAEDWEADNAIYLSWHSNAHNGEARGLFSFVYGSESWGGLDEFQGYPGGVELVTAVHDEIIHDVHAEWDPEWRNGPKVTRWLGETNPRYNNKMPSALIEVGFHDNAEDAEYILDPRFRRIVSRGVYQGIVKYYTENVEGFDIPTLLPEPPENLRVTTDFLGNVTLEWNEPPFDLGEGIVGDAPLDYRVYRSTNGKGWDNGFRVDGTQVKLTGLSPDTTTYFRVTATNVGGESMPTETLTVRPAQNGRSPILIVNGFDRLDREMNLVDENGVQRGILAKMNTYDYAIQHAEALAANRLNFDSASNEAVIDGQVDLKKYETVVWILGKEKGEFETFSEAEQRLVRDFAAGGGGLFVSGSNVAEDLAASDTGRAFLNEVLLADWQFAEGLPLTATVPDDSLFAGVGFVDYGRLEESTYPVTSPDGLRAGTGADVALTYGDTITPAAILGESGHRVVFLGFPFETITDPRKRASMMGRAVFFLREGDPMGGQLVGGG